TEPYQITDSIKELVVFQRTCLHSVVVSSHHHRESVRIDFFQHVQVRDNDGAEQCPNPLEGVVGHEFAATKGGREVGSVDDSFDKGGPAGQQLPIVGLDEHPADIDIHLAEIAG